MKSEIFIMMSEMTESGDVEGFGIAIIEANSLGLPSIGTLGSGIEDAIENNFSGVLVNNNQKEVYASVKKIIESYNF